MREREVRQTISEKSSTIFADNLPVGIRKIWVYNLFSKYGKIREVFIPNKRSKITNQSFGFVRLSDISEATLAIAKVHESWCWGKKLMVKYARFLRIQDKQGEQQSNKGDGYQRNFRGDHRKSSNPKKYSGGGHWKEENQTYFNRRVAKGKDVRLHVNQNEIIRGMSNQFGPNKDFRKVQDQGLKATTQRYREIKRGKEVWRRKGIAETSKQGYKG